MSERSGLRVSGRYLGTSYCFWAFGLRGRVGGVGLGHGQACASCGAELPASCHPAGQSAAWPWSSAAAHVSGRTDGIAETGWLNERIGGWVCTWAQHLRKRDEGDFASRMRMHENTGRPLGDEGFVKKLETMLARVLLPGKPGRPRKRLQNGK